MEAAVTQVTTPEIQPPQFEEPLPNAEGQVPEPEATEAEPPAIPRPLTARQQALFEFIVETISERGCPPSLREMCEQMGARQPNAAHAMVAALERKGWIVRDKGRSRAIRIPGVRWRMVGEATQ
jgi:LexA DNA binding domain